MAVAEVVRVQDTELSRPFLWSVYENRSWLDLLIKSGQAALNYIHNGPQNTYGGFPSPFLQVFFQVEGDRRHEHDLMSTGLAQYAYFSQTVELGQTTEHGLHRTLPKVFHSFAPFAVLSGVGP